MNRTQVQKQFGENAQRYVASPVHARGASLQQMVLLARPQPHWLALDVAPGGGHSALAIARHVRQVVAVDITWPMLRAARAFSQQQGQRNILWIQGDGARLPFTDAQFDLITCRVALHHFPQQATAIADWARCLKSGGRMVLVDNIGPEDAGANAYIDAFEKLRDPSQEHTNPPSILASYIQSAGMHLLGSSTQRKPMLFHDWMARMQVSGPDRKRLTALLWESEGNARSFLNPQGEGAETTFDLQEGLFLAEKP